MIISHPHTKTTINMRFANKVFLTQFSTVYICQIQNFLSTLLLMVIEDTYDLWEMLVLVIARQY